MKTNFHSRTSESSQSLNSPVDRILHLQLTVGNQAVPRLAQSCLVFPKRCPFGGACHTCPARVQAELTVIAPGDQYKQETDRVAEQMMRMSEPRVQRQTKPEEDEEENIQTKPLASQITPLIQRYDCYDQGEFNRKGA